MGQLERYGLYVLVLVIFLILGVAIWGGEPQAKSIQGVETETLDGGTPLSQAPPAAAEIQSPTLDLDDLLDMVPAESAPTQLAAAGGEELVPAESTGLPADPAPMREGAVDPRPERSASTRETYTIQDGDTVSELAQKKLGSTRHTQRILDLNPGLDPKRMRKGTVIVLPSQQELGGGNVAQAASTADLSSPTQHTVQAGEYPGLISQRYYGTVRYAQHILDANGIRDPKKLIAGRTITIPPPPEK